MAKKSTDPLAADIREDETEKANESGKTITNSLLQHVASIVESCNATALFVYVDALDDAMPDLGDSLKAKMFCVTKGRAEEKNASNGCLQCWYAALSCGVH